MSSESNKAVVRRYFEEVLDQRKLDTLDQIATLDCVINRPEAQNRSEDWKRSSRH